MALEDRIGSALDPALSELTARLDADVRAIIPPARRCMSEDLDVLAESAGRETARAAGLVVKRDRLLGWKLSGFGSHGPQPTPIEPIEMSLEGGGIVGLAVSEARPISTRGR